MFTAETLRKKALLCFRLSRAAAGDPIAEELRKLGQDFEQAADRMDYVDEPASHQGTRVAG
ncbi:MAG: hypothetical protein AB7F35_11985 [Acetobacteraceae bacterium]